MSEHSTYRGWSIGHNSAFANAWFAEGPCGMFTAKETQEALKLAIDDEIGGAAHGPELVEALRGLEAAIALLAPYCAGDMPLAEAMRLVQLRQAAKSLLARIDGEGA